MKNGILLKNQLSFSGIKKLLLHLDELQEQYLATMDQTQIQLYDINSYSDSKLNLVSIYSSNKPFELLETLQNYLIEIKNVKNSKYVKLNWKLKQLMFSLNKAKAIQQQFQQYLEVISNIVQKLKYKKECQILIASFSLILKKRQKFQLKLLQKNNQLSENLNNLSELVIKQENNKDNIKQYLEIKTLQKILDKKVVIKISKKNSAVEPQSSTDKVKEEYHNSGICSDNQKHLQLYYDQPQMYYSFFDFQMYQQYCYINQLKQTECNILNTQLLYQQHPYIYHFYPQFQ
ncbi:unnamed protein product [Paramecium sonneborni]|uniref:Uncharacterized protein n=1 Tax=Paramecium sonneborni TaxID=65129 RepID=A0A8S1MDG6_9CILI|nr:unnamed protein product [Paramecium sonneborni]